MSGNDAIGEGALRAGLTFYAGYPITPQNELTAYMAEHLPLRGGVFLQSESEIAAINMVYGAAAAGVRAMTSSSSPGISLKQEGLSYIAAAHVPVVVVNVMRAGPGLGNIWPSQSDYFQATKGGGHGDYRMIVLAPSTVQESLDLTRKAFALSDRYRIGVMILSDGMLGQMMEGVTLPVDEKIPALVDKPWALTGAAGRTKNIVCSLFMERDGVEKNNLALQKKYRRIMGKEVEIEAYRMEGAVAAIVAYGSMARIGRAVVDGMRRRGIKVGLLRPISLWPFPAKEIARFSKKTRRLLVVEMSFGQMVEDVRLNADKGAEIRFYGRGGGGIPSQKQVERELVRLLGKKTKA